MLWTVRDVTDPDDESTFEIELEDTPKIGELVTFLTTIYGVVALDADQRVIEVEQQAGPADETV
jgi:hypothetical protein